VDAARGGKQERERWWRMKHECENCGSESFERITMGFSRHVPASLDAEAGTATLSWDRVNYFTNARCGVAEDRYVCVECGEELSADFWSRVRRLELVEA
jgi:ribosomal protein L37AE/L43A